MSARHFRRKRWEQWNRRPATRALASQGRRERFTSAELDGAVDTSLEAGRVWGRREGEQDLFRALADDFVLREDAVVDDLIALAAYIGGKAMGDEVDDLLRRERVRYEHPDEARRLEDALDGGDVQEAKDALEALARKMGLFPEGDDLLDVADAAGVTPLDPGAADDLLDEVERFLRRQDGGA